MPGLPVHYQLPELAQTRVHWVNDEIQPSHPLSSPSSLTFNLSQHQGFSNELVLPIRWPKYWSFHFSTSPSNEYSELISFRKDLLDLLATQGTLKGLLQYHSSNTSILQHSAFFIVQLSHPYMTTGKNIALTRQAFVGKVMSLLFNKLSMLVINFLLRSKHLLISWLQSSSAVILEPKKIKSVTVSIVFPSISHEVMGPGAMILVFLNAVLANHFTLLFHFHQETLRFLFTFCPKGGVICISEVIDISPGNFDSSLCFIQYYIVFTKKKTEKTKPLGVDRVVQTHDVTESTVLICPTENTHTSNTTKIFRHYILRQIQRGLLIYSQITNTHIYIPPMCIYPKCSDTHKTEKHQQSLHLTNIHTQFSHIYGYTRANIPNPSM